MQASFAPPVQIRLALLFEIERSRLFCYSVIKFRGRLSLSDLFILPQRFIPVNNFFQFVSGIVCLYIELYIQLIQLFVVWVLY